MTSFLTAPALAWALSYWAMQAAAAVIIAWGGRHPAWGVYSFIGGNIVSAASLGVLMLLYRHVNVSVGYGLGVGGAVLCAQVALALAFRTHLTPAHYAGAACLVAGIVCFALAE